MNKLIVLGLLAIIINSINATYTFTRCVNFDDEDKEELQSLVDDDFEDACALLKTEGDFTHCCYVKESTNSSIVADCVQITDDQYENIKNFKKYIIDENGDDDFEIDCSSRFLAISLLAVLAFLF